MPLPSLDTLFSTFGIAATVTPPAAAAIATTVIVGSRTAEFPASGQLAVAGTSRVVSLRRDEVPSVPENTLIVTAEGTWYVDTVVEEDAQIVKVAVR